MSRLERVNLEISALGDREGDEDAATQLSRLRAEREVLLLELANIKVRLNDLFAQAAAYRETARRLKREREQMFPPKNEDADELPQKMEEEEENKHRRKVTESEESE